MKTVFDFILRNLNFLFLDENESFSYFLM